MSRRRAFVARDVAHKSFVDRALCRFEGLRRAMSRPNDAAEIPGPVRGEWVTGRLPSGQIPSERLPTGRIPTGRFPMPELAGRERMPRVPVRAERPHVLARKFGYRSFLAACPVVRAGVCAHRNHHPGVPATVRATRCAHQGRAAEGLPADIEHRPATGQPSAQEGRTRRPHNEPPIHTRHAVTRRQHHFAKQRVRPLV
jgi:hypothetical protein